MLFSALRVLVALAALGSALLLAVPASALSPAATCDEAALKRDALALLTAHFDVELGAVAPGDAQHVGFQHLKTADALLAAQAIAHDDFDRAALHFRNVLRFQRGDGQLPHLVYGGSVPSTAEWLASNRTFHPGPAFWTRDSSSSSSDSKESNDNDHQPQSASLVTSSVLAPPIAADVAWQIFQLSPYETVLGVVGYKANAVQFLCDAYLPLKKLQALLLGTRAVTASNSTEEEPLLLASHHPWETFSPLSPHWISFLATLKSAADYAEVTESIPEQAKGRFAEGARALYTTKSALEDLYKPMIYLARCVSKTLHGGHSDSGVRARTSGPCGFQVFDTEFNSLALRSAHALVQIARVLVDHASVCSEFKPSRKEMLADVIALRAVEARLKAAVLGAGNASQQPQGLWNATSQFFDDSAPSSPTAVHSLRGVMPGYAVAGLPEHQAMGLAEHFLGPSNSFHFFCSRFPTPFFTCSPELGMEQLTVTLYNYFVQRAFSNNGFPGVSEYIRNKTRDMVCDASGAVVKAIAMRRADTPAPAPTPALFALAYTSEDAVPVGTFEDGFVGSTLAAAAFLNILLPAVAAPPSPDAPPVDHRILTVIMCIELVVAFLVALGCVFFSVYFVIKRPREAAADPADDAGASEKLGRVPSARKQHRTGDDGAGTSGPASSSSHRRSRQRGESDPRSSVGDRSLYSEYSEQDDLEEPLLSDDDDPAYGSFEVVDRGRQQQQQQQQHRAASWSAVKDALAAISPW